MWQVLKTQKRQVTAAACASSARSLMSMFTHLLLRAIALGHQDDSVPSSVERLSVLAVSRRMIPIALGQRGSSATRWNVPSTADASLLPALGIATARPAGPRVIHRDIKPQNIGYAAYSSGPTASAACPWAGW